MAPAPVRLGSNPPTASPPRSPFGHAVMSRRRRPARTCPSHRPRGSSGGDRSIPSAASGCRRGSCLRDATAGPTRSCTVDPAGELHAAPTGGAAPRPAPAGLHHRPHRRGCTTAPSGEVAPRTPSAGWSRPRPAGWRRRSHRQGPIPSRSLRRPSRRPWPIPIPASPPASALAPRDPCTAPTSAPAGRLRRRPERIPARPALQRSRGSSASRNPSPRKLKASMVMQMKVAGKNRAHGAARKARLPSAASTPQEAMGACTPRPK